MTKNDLKDIYKNISKSEFIISNKYPELLAYNLKGEIKNLKTGLIIKDIKYRNRKTNDNVGPLVYVIIENKSINVLRDIVSIFYNNRVFNKFIIGYNKGKNNLVSWSNIKLQKAKKSREVSYTKEEIIKYINENNILSQAELRRRNSKMYSSAKYLGILSKVIDSSSRIKVDPEAKINWIYAYFSKKEKVVYIGRTFSNQRDKDHRSSRINDSVYKGFKELNEEIPEWQILENNLKLLESAEKEIQYIKYYKEKGYRLLNKNKGGSIGNVYLQTLPEVKEYCKQVALSCKTQHEFFANHKKEWKKAQRNGWLKEYTWLKSNSDLNTPTKEEVIEVAKSCKNLYEFSRKHNHEYYYALKWGIINELFSNKLHNGPKNRTLESAKIELDNYKSRKEVSRTNASLFNWFKKNDPAYLDQKFPKPQYNTVDSVFECAKSCSSLAEFRRKDEAKYAYAHRNGLLNEIKRLYE